MVGGEEPHSPKWPALNFETRQWTSNPDIPHRHRLTFLGPYKAAVSPSIAKLAVTGLISPEALWEAEDATAEIVRFDAELGTELAPFAALLLRSESAASSRIENLTASAKAIALAELGDPSRTNASIIVANTRAMQAAIDLADHLDDNAIIAMHAALLDRSNPTITGRWRDQQVWIGPGDFGPHIAGFVPPHHERVPDAMADLIEFCNRTDLQPLVQAAVAHAQFETIHPFPDGNGRTGRALIHSLLRGKGITRNVTVPVSAGLLTDVGAYFDALNSYRSGNPNEVVTLMAHASLRSIVNGRQLANEIRATRQRWVTKIETRQGSSAHRVAELLAQHPVIDSPLLQRELGVAASSALLAIEHLESVGILTKVAGNSRNRKWAAGEILDSLDRFAERGGRRG
jgi:Fic family protein